MMTPFCLFEIEKAFDDQEGLTGLFRSFAQYRFVSFTAGPLAVGLVFPKQSEWSASLGKLKDGLRNAFRELTIA
jgi:hypothetical protein